MDINALKKKLNQLQTSTSIKDNLWKPKPGQNQIRIVPYAHNKDNPFIELFFHYDIGNRSYLSPMSFGRPDPIEEFAEKLKGSGNRDDWNFCYVYCWSTFCVLFIWRSKLLRFFVYFVSKSRYRMATT